MKVIFQERAKQGNGEYVLLQHSTKTLEEVVGNDVDPVTAEWDRAEDAKGQPLYVLRLSDWAGAVSTVFAPDELQSPSHMRSRINRLWGHLLQVRSSRQLRELMGSGQEER